MDAKYVEIFWSHVRKGDGCWEWAASLGSHGYGNAWDGRTVRTAHRVSWELHKGPIPDGLFVLHTCDNKRCVRPDHLWLGTAADNSRDMAAKGRNVAQTRPHLLARGEHQGSARLTSAKVRDIRRRYGAGEPPRLIAAAFGITTAHVWRLAKLRAWAHVA